MRISTPITNKITYKMLSNDFLTMIIVIGIKSIVMIISIILTTHFAEFNNFGNSSIALSKAFWYFSSNSPIGTYCGSTSTSNNEVEYFLSEYAFNISLIFSGSFV